MPRKNSQSDEPTTISIDTSIQRSPKQHSHESPSISTGVATQIEDREGGSSVMSQFSSATSIISDQLPPCRLAHEVQARSNGRNSAILQAERKSRFVRKTSSKTLAPVSLEVSRAEEANQPTLNTTTDGSSEPIKRASYESFETSVDGLGPQDSASQVLGRDGGSSTMSQLSAIAVAIPDLPSLRLVQRTQPHSRRRDWVTCQVDSGLRFVRTTPSELSTSLLDLPPAYTAT